MSRLPPALKWPQRRATIGRAALCVRAAPGVWLGGGRAAAPAAALGGLVRAFARPPAFLALARCALCSLAVCAFAQRVPARRACVLPPVAAVVRGLRVGRARAVASCFGVFLRWRRGGGLALASCPSGLRRRRPSRRRFAVRWRGSRRAAAWGGVGRLPRPLAVSPSSAWAAWPLAALCFASPRRAVVRLPRPVSRPRRASGRCRWRLFRRLVGGGAGRCARFRGGVSPFPRRARGALPPSPLRAPVGRTRAVILAGAGGRALVPCSRWSQSVARGARALASPLSRRLSSRRWRARSACRAVCSFRALRRASPPSSGWPGSAVRDVSSSSFGTQGGRARAFRRSDRRRWRRFTQTARKSQRGEVSPAPAHKILCTKSPRAVKTAQGQSLSRQDGQSCPQNRGKAQKSPEMPSKCARPDQRRAKRDSQSPNGQQIGRKWAVKCRRAVCPSGRGQTVPRWRRSANNAASSPRKRRQFRPRSPSGKGNICRPGGIHRLKSSIRAGTCWENASALPRAHVSPRRAARAASSPASPLAHGHALTIFDHDTTIPAQKQAIPAPS